jgi:hypothetical protein
MRPEDEFVNAIASDVLKVFAEQRFFEDLGDRMCPEDHDLPCLSCKGRFAISANILANADFDADDISDITAVLQSKGACCDCQALYNLAPESRLKSEYWKCRASGAAPQAVHSPGYP